MEKKAKCRWHEGEAKHSRHGGRQSIVGAEEGEASPARRKAKRRRCRERRSVANAKKLKRHRCREIEGYGGNDFRNRCEWFVPASVVNRCESFGFVLR